MNRSEITSIENRVIKSIEEAVSFALESPFTEISKVQEDIYV